MNRIVFSACHCEQLVQANEELQIKSRTCHADEHLEGCMRILTTEIKPG
jgi:hypothetical protein